MTILDEPLKSNDPLNWLVYADWLEDHGEMEKSTRARNIARGIKKSGGKLWVTQIENKNFCSGLNNLNVDSIVLEECLENNYTWALNPVEARYPIERSHVPWENLRIADSPYMLKEFWNVMERIGAEES